MKIIKRLVLLFIFVFCISIINVNASGVTIRSINLVDHIGSATEISAPTASGLNINFDLAFVDVNDTAKYEVVLNNPTNTEYEISLDNKFNSSNYMEYSYEFKDKSNRIKANSEVVLYITIKYKNAVPVDSLVEGKYVENNTLGISLLNEKNPNTFGNILLLLIIILGIIGFTILSTKMKNKDVLVIIIALLIIPVTVFAIEKLKIVVETKITIGEYFNVYYEVGNAIKTSDLNSDYYCLDHSDDTKLEQENGTYVDYTYCKNVFKKDSEPHFVGERVNVTPRTSTFIIYDYCVKDSNDNYTCPKESFVTNNIEYYMYYCDYGFKKRGTTCSEDLGTLNFESIRENYWDSNYYVLINTPNKFTMPGHDVYFLLTDEQNPGYGIDNNDTG